MLLFAGYGYTLCDRKLDIEGEAYIRIDEEIIITNVSLNNVNDGLEIYNVEYSKNSIKAGIKLNSNASTVTYKVEVTKMIGSFYETSTLEKVTVGSDWTTANVDTTDMFVGSNIQSI